MTDEEIKMIQKEETVRKQIYADCTGLGMERTIGRAKPYDRDFFVYGFPMVIGKDLHIVRPVKEESNAESNEFTVEGGRIDPKTLQMKVNVGGWNLWEDDILKVERPGCKPEYGVLSWSEVEYGGWTLLNLVVEKDGDKVLLSKGIIQRPFVDTAYDDKADITQIGNWLECAACNDGAFTVIAPCGVDVEE